MTRFSKSIGRFAPSTTGPAHPGTLLAALLCWLDARHLGGRVRLRLEDLDPERCRPEWAQAMPDALAWLGLDWDGLDRQSDFAARHDEVLDRLAAEGRLYPCDCTRQQIRALGERSPDGGFRYPNRCRSRELPPQGWRATDSPLRVRLPDGRLEVLDESGLDLSQDPARELGDPVVRRRDGSLSYLLASVVDDAEAGVTRVVRGRDLAASTATQVRLAELLSVSAPRFRHHPLLLERRGGKLAKLHGSVGWDELRAVYSAPELCGILACAVDLRPDTAPCTPAELLADFAWDRVGDGDRILDWRDGRLHVVDRPEGSAVRD